MELNTSNKQDCNCTQKDDILKIKHILYGNGEKGICENIRDIQKDITEIKKYIEKNEAKIWGLINKIVPYILAAMLGYNQFFNGTQPPIQ